MWYLPMDPYTGHSADSVSRRHRPPFVGSGGETACADPFRLTDGNAGLSAPGAGERPTPTVLYVDDDAITRRAAREVLRVAGFEVREAASGEEALRLLGKRPDLVVLDVNLPDMVGFEVCRRIKSDPATASIPVLHVSGVFVRLHDKAQGLEGGADGYLTKPIDPEELLATVRAMLRTHWAEEAARLAARHWAATFDAIREGVWLVDGRGQILRCNRAMGELLGRDRDAVSGREYRDLLAEAFGEGAGALIDLLVQGAVGPEEVQVGDRWLEASTAGVVDEGDREVGQVHVLADVTRRKQTEEQLRQSQKLEAVGRLASGIAHDFNNLLTAITGNLWLLLSRTDEADPRRELLRMTEEVSWHAADLTRQLLAYARKGRLVLAPTEVGACVEGTVAILRRTFDPRIEIEVEVPPGLWLVYADPTQMGQVVMNLCLNARDAMPEGGTLRVGAENVTLEGAETEGSGEYVCLRVRDTGVGMPPEVRMQAFDPFYTTKETGRGTGLGLAVVYGIVQQHHGRIDCLSEPGQGTCFSVYLPRYRSP
jgi:PAS domain S-box-containing protein